MATGKDLGALVGQIGADIREWEKAAMTMQKDLDKIEKRGQRMSRSLSKSLDKASKQMQAAGKQMSMYISAPLTAVAGLAVKTAADFETLRTSMDILNGSVEEGARNFERLKEFSARTPFQLQDLARAQNMLQGFGLAADEAFESLSMIGDIAAVSGGSIEGIGIAFGQAAAEGKLMTRDIRQLINQGVPAIKLLADSMDVAQSEVLDLASQGKISFDILQQAFRDATSEGGMFANGMEKQSKTLTGLFSTLRDNVSIALGELGTSISETFDLKEVLQNTINFVQGVVDAFKDLSKESKAQILKVAGLFTIAGPAVFAIGKFVGILGSMIGVFRKVLVGMVTIATSAMGRIGVAFMAGLVIGQHFVNNMKALFSGNFDEMNSIFSGWADAAVDAVQNVFGPIVRLGDKAFSKLAEGIGEVTGTKGALASFYKLMEGGAKSTADQIQNLKQRIAALADEISKTEDIDKIKELTSQIQKLKKELQRLQQQQQQSKGGGAARTAGQENPTVPSIPVPIKPVVNKIIPSDLSLESMTKGIDLNLGEKIFPPGSLGDLREKLNMLHEKMLFAFTPEQVMQLQEQISLTEEQIAQLTGQTQQSGQALAGFVQTIDNVFQQAVLHGEKLGDILANIAKQLASKALINGLAMLLSGGTFSVGKLLFGSIGSIFGVGDALIRDNGDVVKFHPDDNILAMKDFSKLGMVGAPKALPPANQGQVIYNYLELDGEVVWKSQKRVSHRRRR